MDPAFSLADELSDFHHDELDAAHYASGSTLDDELHHDVAHFASGSTLDDELLHHGGLDAELDGLHLHGHGQDLASELGGGGGRLADELEPDFATYQGGEQLDGEMAGQSSSMEAGLNSPSPPRPSRGADTSSTSILPLIPPGDISDTLAATEAFISRLSTLSSTNKASTSDSAVGTREDGDTARLEAVAARYLKLVSQCTVEREAQLRELRELDRRLERDLPSFASLPTATSWSSDLVSSPTTHLNALPEEPLQREEPHHSTQSEQAPLDNSHFTPLYTSTTTLLSTLTSIHEHTQVTKSTTADAARKLKNVKALVDKWKGEMESVALSEEWISQTSGKERDGAWAKDHLEWCRGRIEGVEERARGLLTPVSLAS